MCEISRRDPKRKREDQRLRTVGLCIKENGDRQLKRAACHFYMNKEVFPIINIHKVDQNFEGDGLVINKSI